MLDSLPRLTLLLILAFSSLAFAGRQRDQGPTLPLIPKPGGKPVDLPGLPNVLHVSGRLLSGGVPEGDAGFQSLQKLGVKTILSVDGARPDLTRARKFEMRYVHLPIGYDGVSQTQAMALARAVRDLPGPVYIHCHHGKHRSPGAAAAIQFCLDPQCTAAQAIEIMKRAGTDSRYTGLFAVPTLLKRPTPQDLDALRIDFPEIARVPALTQAMVQIDERWEHLGRIRMAGWTVPANHPDLDPPHEALHLVEHYREMARTPETKARPADFRSMLAEAEEAARDLESILRKAKKAPPADRDSAEKAYQQSRVTCTRCHAKYRDIPQPK